MKFQLVDTTANKQIVRFARNLKEYRQKRGYSQHMLARMAQISQSALSDIENETGFDLKLSSALKLCAALDVDIGHLLGTNESSSLEAKQERLGLAFEEFEKAHSKLSIAVRRML